MIPFESGRSPDPHRRGGGGRGDLGAGDWGGRLGTAAHSPLEQEGTRLLFDVPEHGAPVRRSESRAAWLVAPLMLAAAAAGVIFVLRGPDRIFAVAFEIVLALGVLWILVSALFPAKADRTCPECAGAGLQRLDRLTTEGLVCGLCGWCDASASSFYLAEDEGPLEDIVLRERARRERRP